jgi:hypothetical protein
MLSLTPSEGEGGQGRWLEKENGQPRVIALTMYTMYQCSVSYAYNVQSRSEAHVNKCSVFLYLASSFLSGTHPEQITLP